MDVHIEAVFDSAGAPDAPGRALVQWFRAARLELFRGLVEAEATGDGKIVSEAQLIAHVDDAPRRFPQVGRTWQQFEEGLAGFPWGANITFLSGHGELHILGRTSSLHVLGGGSAWRASAAVTLNSPDDAPSCLALVDFLHTALDSSTPAFGRIEGNNFHELTNLDAVLRRRKRTSLRESRQFLRGYAWATVARQSSRARLGGAAKLKRTGAFHRVAEPSWNGCVSPEDARSRTPKRGAAFG
ncbi:hypothetical protein ABZ341_40905 [Streptomyces sp. NPDC006173]|uniref:hypothetical protein n=1 Tax=Streptomyces sp. NPDC006173 TaxID=3155349 RepID=UPI0033CBCF51